MKPHICLVYPCGRTIVSKVIQMLVRQLKGKRYFDQYDISLIISYDLSYQSLKTNDFIQPKEIEALFQSTLYIDVNDFNSLQWVKYKYKIPNRGFEVLFKPRGYCTQKNVSMLNAVLIKSDFVIFLDDDEYYSAPEPDPNEGLRWREQDVLGKHMECLPNADVTNGIMAGYFSPIPSDLGVFLNEKTRKILGRTLSYGSEFINENTFLKSTNNIRYIDSAYDRLLPKPVQFANGTGFLTGGNLGVNMNTLKDGKFPPVFNPKYTRGEDAILGTQVKNLRVFEIPVYTFHDPFLIYTCIPEFNYPKRIAPICLSPSSINRFLSAFLGWIGYAPLFIKLTSVDEHVRCERLRYMQSSLPHLCETMSDALNCNGFNEGSYEFARHCQQMEDDYTDYMYAQDSWRLLIERVLDSID